jgi:hypothetical protein
VCHFGRHAETAESCTALICSFLTWDSAVPFTAQCHTAREVPQLKLESTRRHQK